MATAAELVTKISFVGSIQPLDRLNTGLITSIKSISVVTVAFTAGGMALNSWVGKTLDATYKTIELSDSIRTSVESLQEWQYIAQQTGSSNQAIENSFSNLSNKIADYVNFNKGEGKTIFEGLGISVKDSNGVLKSTDVVLQELGNKLKKFDKLKQKGILEQLGIDETMITALNLTGDKIDLLKNKARDWGVVTSEQAEQVMEYKKSLTDLGFGVESLKTQLAISFSPVLKEVIDSFKGWYSENKELISNGLNKTFEILSSFGGALKNTWKFIDKVVTGTTGWTAALGILTAAFIYSRRAFLMSPFGIAAAIIAALILVVDDIVVAFRGGNSVLKDFFASFNIDIVKALTSAFDILKGIFYENLGVLLQLSESIVAFFALLEKGGKFIGIDFNLGLDDKVKQIKELKEHYQDLSKQNFSEAYERGISLNKPNTSINQNANLPKNTANSTTNTQNNNVSIEVKTDNPALAGESVKNALNQQISSANNQFKSGGF